MNRVILYSIYLLWVTPPGLIPLSSFTPGTASCATSCAPFIGGSVSGHPDIMCVWFWFIFAR